MTITPNYGRNVDPRSFLLAGMLKEVEVRLVLLQKLAPGNERYDCTRLLHVLCHLVVELLLESPVICCPFAPFALPLLDRHRLNAALLTDNSLPS